MISASTCRWGSSHSRSPPRRPGRRPTRPPRRRQRARATGVPADRSAAPTERAEGAAGKSPDHSTNSAKGRSRPAELSTRRGGGRRQRRSDAAALRPPHGRLPASFFISRVSRLQPPFRLRRNKAKRSSRDAPARGCTGPAPFATTTTRAWERSHHRGVGGRCATVGARRDALGPRNIELSVIACELICHRKIHSDESAEISHSIISTAWHSSCLAPGT